MELMSSQINEDSFQGIETVQYLKVINELETKLRVSEQSRYRNLRELIFIKKALLQENSIDRLKLENSALRKLLTKQQRIDSRYQQYKSALNDCKSDMKGITEFISKFIIDENDEIRSLRAENEELKQKSREIERLQEQQERSKAMKEGLDDQNANSGMVDELEEEIQRLLQENAILKRQVKEMSHGNDSYAAIGAFQQSMIKLEKYKRTFAKVQGSGLTLTPEEALFGLLLRYKQLSRIDDKDLLNETNMEELIKKINKITNGSLSDTVEDSTKCQEYVDKSLQSLDKLSSVDMYKENRKKDEQISKLRQRVKVLQDRLEALGGDANIRKSSFDPPVYEKYKHDKRSLSPFSNGSLTHDSLRSNPFDDLLIRVKSLNSKRDDDTRPADRQHTRAGQYDNENEEEDANEEGNAD